MHSKMVSKYLSTKEHKEWSKAIRDMEGQCAVNDNCSPTLNAHHLIPKEIKKYRSNINNGICLCGKHHTRWGFGLSPHSDASFLFFLWLQKHRPTQFDWVQEHWEDI